jgi:hypothetical protein
LVEKLLLQKQVQEDNVCCLIKIFVSAVSKDTSKGTVWILVDVYLADVIAGLVSHFHKARSLMTIPLHPVK